MAFCPYCGKQLDDDMRFCPSCGKQVNANTSDDTSYNTAQSDTYNISQAEENDYNIILLSKGDCTKSAAADFLEDMFGYSSSEAKQLIENTPIEIAQGLNATQARYLVQALSEYGMQVSSSNSLGYVDFSSYANKSVFDDEGSFVRDALAVFGTISAINRVREIRRWTRPDPFGYMFVPRYTRRRPPVRRRGIFGLFAPPPPPRRTPPPPPRRTPPPPKPPRPSGGPGRGPAKPSGGPGRGPAKPSGGPGRGPAKPSGGPGRGPAKPSGGPGRGPSRPSGGPGRGR